MGEAPEKIYYALVNHWHHHGKGWQRGEESSQESFEACFRAMEALPGLVVSQNWDGDTLRMANRVFPDVMEKVRLHVREGKMDFVGGTFSQPHGFMFGAESNIRQLQMGKRAIEATTGDKVLVFAEEEPFFHPQMPQLLKKMGYEYAALYSKRTVTDPHLPELDIDPFLWKGVDGSTIITLPKTHLCTPDDRNYEFYIANFAQLFRRPLFIDYTEPPAVRPLNEFFLPVLRSLVAAHPLIFTTLTHYCLEIDKPDRCLSFTFDLLNPTELMHAEGGDQLRIRDREVENLLLVAETMDVMNVWSGGTTCRDALSEAWEKLLLSQGHGIHMLEFHSATLCDNQPKGSIGFSLIQEAEKVAKKIIQTSIEFLIDRSEQSDQQGKGFSKGISIFNPMPWPSAFVSSCGIGCDEQMLHVEARDGTPLPAQKDGFGRISFLTPTIPPFTWAALKVKPDPTFHPYEAKAHVIGDHVVLSNGKLVVEISRSTGSLVKLIDEENNIRIGHDMGILNVAGRVFEEYPFYKPTASGFASVDTEASVEMISSGPARAIVRAGQCLLSGWKCKPVSGYENAQSPVPIVMLETDYILNADAHELEIMYTLTSEVPPTHDLLTAYRLELNFNMPNAQVYRDYPFGVELANGQRADVVYPKRVEEYLDQKFCAALTFLDVVDGTKGIQISHTGTQLFAISDQTGRIANFWARQMELPYTGRFGWNRVMKYRYSIRPHGAEWTNVDRLRTAQRLVRHPVITSTEVGRNDDHCFLRVDPPDLMLTSVSMVDDGVLEVRLFEANGEQGTASLIFGMPIHEATLVDLQGQPLESLVIKKDRIVLAYRPRSIFTLKIR